MSTNGTPNYGILEEYKDTILEWLDNGYTKSEVRSELAKVTGLPEVNKKSLYRALKRWEDEDEEVEEEEIPQPLLRKLLNDPLIVAGRRFEPEEETQEQKLHRQVVGLEADLAKAKNLLKRYETVAQLDDRIVAEISDAVNRNQYKPKLARPKRKTSSGSSHEMLLLVSDAHYPEVVNPAEAMGIEYGPDTCRARMEQIVEKTILLSELRENSYPIDKLTIAVLGDMLSGNIHEELEITNAIPMGEALTDMSYMLHDMGSICAEHFPEVEMVVMPGNHPRMTKKPRNKQKWDNFEYIMGQLVKALAQDAYEVKVPKDIIYIHDIMGMNIGMTHGDGSKAASFAGIPFYALKQRTNALQAMLGNIGLDRLDMLVMGHFHQMLSWTEGDCHIFINGAIKGGDEYSVVTRHQATDPVQALLTFNANHGWIGTERINL